MGQGYHSGRDVGGRRARGRTLPHGMVADVRVLELHSRLTEGVGGRGHLSWGGAVIPQGVELRRRVARA